MSNFGIIQKKLNDFVRKYYTNEIIRGSILFLSFGLLYFVFTLFVEYFLWLKPGFRTFLFWLFIIVELGLLTKFILFPLSKLIGIGKGITKEEASKIIGRHFSEIDDKLLNILQLNKDNDQSELLLASIEQKSTEIAPIPFKKAINYSSNKKYIKYLSIPLVIFLFSLIGGKDSIFTNSFDRVVHYKTSYSPPAPYYFQINNESLEVIEGKSFKLSVNTIGEVVPEQVKIYYNNQGFLLKKINLNEFEFEFERLNNSLPFYLESGDVKSNVYDINVLKTPKITDFEMDVDYPNYTNKKDEVIRNTGNLTVPIGTKITWNLETEFTQNVGFLSENEIDSFAKNNDYLYSYSKKMLKNLSYKISSSNENLQDYENLAYHIQVIKDEYPKIVVKSDIDSISRNDAHFVGQLSDDYGLLKLQVVYKEVNSTNSISHNIELSNENFETFNFIFPNKIKLVPSKTYELYFEVFDNDRINGSKSVKSKTYFYNQKSKEQINQELMREQEKNIEDLNRSKEDAKDINKKLEEFNNKLKGKKELDWNDKKDIDDYLKRQNQYQKMIEKNTDKMLDNLNEIDEKNETLSEEKDQLKERLEELKELEKNEKLLKELEELSEKLKKEGLIDKLDKLTEKNKQQNRSLERLLELTKRFYVEKKTLDIIENLNELSKDQKELAEDNKENSSEEQNELNKKFDSIQKEMNELNKENKNLKEPMPLPNTVEDQKEIQKEMKEASEKLSDKKESKKAKKNQKSAAQKMDELSKKMTGSMQQMEMESLDENIKDLQQILDNLLIFSFQQEELMISFKDIETGNSEFPNKLREQQKLKVYFEHIDDSLYTLSMRMVKISSRIQTDLTDVHFNINKSLEHLSDNKIEQGMSNQQYTMTATNNLADLLSDILQSLQNSNSMGKGKGKNGESISLPDIIKKQKELGKKALEGMEKGKKKGNQQKEQLSGEQFEIYKEQMELRSKLQKMIDEKKIGSSEGKKALGQMEQLEKILLEKGLTENTIKRMQQLEYELIKMEKAWLKQGKSNKRKSESNKIDFDKRNINDIDLEEMYFNQDEILIRKAIPLNEYYQSRVKEYFQTIEE